MRPGRTCNGCTYYLYRYYTGTELKSVFRDLQKFTVPGAS